MDIYLVGGAVRDQLLELEITDKDWLVVGASIEQMLKLGYLQVGSDFPVFLHPKTKQEYALARTEKKSGLGYTGFICDFAPSVSLEEDLIRRDLTINAIAMDKEGNFHDPHNGKKDIENRVLRHVSPAFIEDPLRVIRVARFAARFHHLGFTIAQETLDLMKKISQSGELKSLTAERIWKEWEKSLDYSNPEIFIDVLRQCGALNEILPEIDKLFGVPQPELWHPEIDTGLHTLMVARQAALITQDPQVRFAAQLHDLGKGLTDPKLWPKHHGHEMSGKKPIQTLCQRLKIPNNFKDLALIVCAEHSNVHRAFELKATTFISIFDRIDAWRKPLRVSQLVQACKADSQGRTGFESTDYPQAILFEKAFEIAQSVEVKVIVEAGFQGKDIKDELNKQRVEKLKNYLNSVREKQEK